MKNILSNEEKFTTFDIRDKLKIKIERQKDWLTRNYIQPSIGPADGPGTKNLFCRYDLYLIRLFQTLLERGFPRNHAAGIIAELKNLRDIAKDYEERGRKDPKLIKMADTWKSTLEADILVLPWDAGKWRVWGEKPKAFPIVNNGEDLKIAAELLRDFDEIRIINFKKIRDQVDDVLS